MTTQNKLRLGFYKRYLKSIILQYCLPWILAYILKILYGIVFWKSNSDILETFWMAKNIYIYVDMIFRRLWKQVMFNIRKFGHLMRGEKYSICWRKSFRVSTRVLKWLNRDISTTESTLVIFQAKWLLCSQSSKRRS